MAISFRKIKQCMALSAIVLATAPLSGCLVRQSPSKSALEVGVNEPVGKRKTELTKLVDANPLSGRLHRSADSYIGKVSPAIFNQLKYLPLVAPAYVPESFSLVKYDIPASGYVLIYGNSADQCFAIEYDASKRLTADNSTVGNNSSASDVATDLAVSEGVLGQGETGNAELENRPAELPELSAAGASSANSSIGQQPISEDTGAGVPEPVGDTPDFEVFDSPLFGRGKALFYGESAEKMAVSEHTLLNQTLDSDDTALDLLAAPAAESSDAESPAVSTPKTSIATNAATDSTPPTGSSPSTNSTSSTNSALSGPQASVATDQDSLVSQWLRSDEGAYRYVSGSIVTQNYSAQNQCGNVSLEEGVKIVTSLAVLSADSTGVLESNPVPSDNPDYLGEGSQN